MQHNLKQEINADWERLANIKPCTNQSSLAHALHAQTANTLATADSLNTMGFCSLSAAFVDVASASMDFCEAAAKGVFHGAKDGIVDAATGFGHMVLNPGTTITNLAHALYTVAEKVYKHFPPTNVPDLDASEREWQLYEHSLNAHIQTWQETHKATLKQTKLKQLLLGQELRFLLNRWKKPVF